MKLAFIVALLLATSPVAAQIATTTSAATSSASSGTGAEEICVQNVLRLRNAAAGGNEAEAFKMLNEAMAQERH